MIRFLTLYLILLPTLMAAPQWKWQDLPALPQALGGAFAGVLNNNLIVTGGSYWRGAPWIPGSEKIYSSAIYSLAPGARRWRTLGRLPAPSGYGASFVHGNALWLIGGQDSAGAQRSILSVDSTGKVTQRGQLPSPLMMMAKAELNGHYFLFGGQPDLKTCLHSSDLTHWDSLPPWPGPGRFFAHATTANGAIYLAGGADLIGTQRIFLRDAYRWASGSWSPLPDLPVPIQAGFAATIDNAPIILSGSDGSLAPFEANLGEDHPGFSTLIWTFDGTGWLPKGRLPFAPVTSTLVQWQGALVIPGGEDRPAHRSSRVLSGKYLHE